MVYRMPPMGDVWQEGVFSVPVKIAEAYLKMASEYQLKALLYILANNGKAEVPEVAKALGCTARDAEEFLAFWVEEGVLVGDGEGVAATTPTPSAKPVEMPAAAPAPTAKKTVEALPVPTLTPKDVVALCREDAALCELLRNAQEVLGKTLSHAEQEMLINMNHYYGLPCEVVLTILHYCQSERAKGRALGTAYIVAMAKNWSEEGITTLTAADEKLKELESSDRLWREVVALSGIRHRSPTVKQREMIQRWREDFSTEMIALACDAMKENAEKPSLKYVDSVLKNWRKKGLMTPRAVAEDNERHEQSKNESKTKQYAIDATYDVDELTKKAMFKEDYDL